MQRTRDWIVYADLDLDSHAKEDKAGLLLGRFEFNFPQCLHIFARVDWLMMSDQFSSPICQSYLKHMFPFVFHLYSTCSGGLLLVSTDNPPTFIPQDVALNFARQHGGIAANELPDIVNFITQVPHLSVDWMVIALIDSSASCGFFVVLFGSFGL